ncbi:NAD-P-binding protein [Mycena epipterygia]|nr:NAD-P-binding protein [Mycena epipterygia]
MSPPTTSRQYSFPEVSSFNNLVLQTVPVAAPKSNEVLVRNYAVSLQFRDLMISEDAYPLPVPPDLVPCSDMAGEVVAVGADVTQWKIGDRVSSNIMIDETTDLPTTDLGGAVHGVLTEYRAFASNTLVAIPAHLSYEEAATLPCAAVTAYNALTSGWAPVKAGDTILVQGTGGVSTFALQFAVASGATVIALSSSDEKLKQFSNLGAKHVINYKTTPKWEDEILKLTNGSGVDRVIEVVGNTTLQKSIASLKRAGTISIIGAVGGAVDVPPDIILSSIVKSMTIRGIWAGSVKQFKDMNKLMAANPEVTRPIIDKIFPFEEAKAAYAYLQAGPGVGKVVIKI